MHDISIHPPYTNKLTTDEKILSSEYLNKSIEKWLKILKSNGISLSLETHVAGEWFLFNGLHEYVNFIDNHPDLGVLIDISHNYYEPQYSEHDIIGILGNKNVKGLHISDALRGAEFEEGTHLAIGDGTIDFPCLLKGFDKYWDLYCVLEIKSKNAGVERSLKTLKAMTR
jgi:sugar phosphate isomerase/epimerase